MEIKTLIVLSRWNFCILELQKYFWIIEYFLRNLNLVVWTRFEQLFENFTDWYDYVQKLMSTLSKLSVVRKRVFFTPEYLGHTQAIWKIQNIKLILLPFNVGQGFTKFILNQKLAAFIQDTMLYRRSVPHPKSKSYLQIGSTVDFLLNFTKGNYLWGSYDSALDSSVWIWEEL